MSIFSIAFQTHFMKDCLMYPTEENRKAYEILLFRWISFNEKQFK